MTIKATYIGREGSLGYRQGVEYKLILANQRGMTIVREDGYGLCPYESLSTFFKNWTNIQTR